MSKLNRTEINNLAKKAALGIVRVQFFLVLLLFVPAWSLRYWEAWVYLCLFSFSVLFITFYFLRHDPKLIARRLEVGPTAEREPSQKVIQAIAGAFSCAVFIVAGLEHRFHGSSVTMPVVIGANAIILLSLVLVFRVFQENSYTASTVRVEANQPVIATGPYAWIRHPMYAGSIVGYLATPLALGSLFATIPAVLISGMIVVRLLNEERFLSKDLPGYDAYCRQVRYRLIPHIW
jgi:protein-S-isoprenylcysteine O-methyltransferase Ste14